MDKSALCGSGPLPRTEAAFKTFSMVHIEENSCYYSEIGFLRFVIRPAAEPWGTLYIPYLSFPPPPQYSKRNSGPLTFVISKTLTSLYIVLPLPQIFLPLSFPSMFVCFSWCISVANIQTNMPACNYSRTHKCTQRACGHKSFKTQVLFEKCFG